MARFISPITDIKPNGSVNFLDANTNLDKLTYKDELETIPNELSVAVNANGNLAFNVFFSGSATVIYLDEFGTQYASRTPVGEEVGIGNFTQWSVNISYNIPDITIGSNDKFYMSITDANQGNDPVTDSTNWEEIRFIGVWNTNITYSIGDVVQTSDGNLWRAVTATAGNNPSSDDGTNWAVPVAISNLWVTKAVDFNAVSGESYQIDASANTVDITIPVLAIGDSFIFHNLITSTFKVQILNPIETIKGITGDISATTNMEIEAGQSVQIVATSATVLTIVGVLL